MLSRFLRDLPLTFYAIACGELCLLLSVGSGGAQQLFGHGFSNAAALRAIPDAAQLRNSLISSVQYPFSPGADPTDGALSDSEK